MENIAQIEQLQDQLRSLNDTQDEQASTIRSSIDALLSENDTIVNQCSQLDILSASLREATGAYQNWLDKQNSSESGDMFDDALGAMKEIDNVTSNTDSEDYGRIGKNSYKAAVEFVIPESIDSQDAEAVQSYVDSIDNYFTHDEDGNRLGLDVAEFCQRATEQGLMTLDEASGEYQIAGERTMQDFADGLGLALPLVQAMFGEMEEFGGEFSWADEAIKTLGDLGMAAGEAKERIESLSGNENMNVQIDVSDIEGTENKVSALEDTISQMQNYKSTLEVDSSQVDDANAIIEYCVTQKQMLESPSVMSVDASQVEGEVGNALSLLQQFQEAKNNLEVQAAVGADTSEAQSKVDGLVSEIKGLSPEIQATLGIDTTSETTIIDSIKAITPEIMVKAGVDQTLVDAWAAEEKQSKGTVKWDNNTTAVDAWASQRHVSNGTVTWTNNTKFVKTQFTATGYVNWTNTSAPTKSSSKKSGSDGAGSFNGTAHVDGTAHYNHLVGYAHANGNWGTKTSGTALVGELGREIVVEPNGIWHTVGDNGAEFVHIPAGSIVFNHLQTEDLLERGFVNSRGNAYASGTAMVKGGISVNQANIASVKTTYGSSSQSTSQTKSTKAYQQNTKSVEENTASQEANTEATDHSTTTLNWVERRMDIFADTVKNIADRITDYVSTAFKKSNLKKQIAAIDDEISARKHGAEVYMQVADEIASNYEYYDENGNKQSLTIPEEYKLKVQNGDWLVEEMDTSTDFNKNLAEAIQKYQEYYDSAKECTSAVQELKNNQMDLFNDLINIPIEEAEKKIDRIVAKMDVLDAAASSITGQSGLSRYSYQIEADAGMKQLSEKLDSAKTKTKSSIEEAKKAARNSGDSTVKDYIYNQIKNGKYIDTKNLTGNAKKTAEQYNTDLQNQRKIQEQYNTKKKALSDTQKLILNNEGKPTYVIQNAILGENLKNKRDESKEYAYAAKQAEKNRVSTEKDLNATTKKVEKYASDMLKNNNVTKFLNASQINALKNGEEVDTTGIVDPTILQTLKNYNVLAEEKRTAEEKDTIALNALTEAQKNATISQAEYAQMAVENEQQKFANIKDYYDSKIDYNQALQQNQESKISRKKALGASVSKSELERQRKLIENEEKLYIQQRDKLEGQLNKSVASGAIKEGSEEWKALRAEILAADTAANNAASSIANVANEIANIKLDQLEKTKSLFDAIISCCDSVVSMIETAGKYTYNDQDAMNALKGQINYYEKKANNNLESAQENYANYAAAEANNGTYGGKSSEEWLTDYYNSLTEYYNTKGNQYALDKEIRELPLQEMNGALGNLKSVLDVITSGADLKETEGKYLDIMDYQNQIANYSEQIAKQQQINAQYQSLYEQMMAIGADARAAEYYDQWQSGVAELNKMSASVEELSDKIRDDFVESVKRSIDAISDMRDVLESELDIKKSEGKYLGYSDYSDQMRLNSQEYSNQLQIMTDRRKKYSEALLAGNQAEADQMLSEARQAEASANKLLAANAELEKSIQNLFRDTLQRELDALESAQAVLESQMNLIDAQSRDKTKDNFQQQIDMNMDLIHKQEAMARENQRLYNLEVSKGNMEAAAEYLKAWKSADAEVNNLRADIESLGDDMREALLTKDIDKLLDRMEQLRNSMSTISDLINEDMMFDDNGKMTEFGITALAMDIKTYESETDSLKKLIEKRQKYIEEYNNGMNEYYSKNEYDEDMKNISQEIQEMLRDANTTRQAIVEMVAKTSKMEIDALNDVIDKRKELLQAQKDAYDFDKTLKSQTNDLTLLQKQKQALEGLTDKESQAKLQKLNKQIKEAQETLNDTITDHSFDLKIDGLDDLKQDISDAYDEYVKQLNANLEAITSTVTDATDTVVGSLGTVTEAITKLLSSYGVSGLNTDTIGYTRQYAKGTKNHPGGSAIVNDGNGLETVVLPDGSVLLPYLPKGSDVINAEQTAKMMEMMNKNVLKPQIQLQKLNLNDIGRRETDATVNIKDIGGIHIYDATDPDNVMKVIHDNIRDIASDVGKQFSKNVPRTGTKRTWG